MQPSNFPDSQQWRLPAGAWRLALGGAVGLRPRRAGTLEIVQGGVWLTVSGPRAREDCGGREEDVFLHAGDTLRLAGGQHAVLEPWTATGRAGDVAFLWTEECVQRVPVASACGAVAGSLGDLFRAQAALGGALLALGRAVWHSAAGRGPRVEGPAPLPSPMAMPGRH
ncbi:DUF2917 domain-containing protein [Paracidovorax cattleyae]|uniref:DUF2917 domain-containing protein n=1 Tax=Paracidovorax cattleyae TaxID=80868 RepID=A0A1H0N5U4_9BURK|nr:DUF2917 domain-containing protein [Paracidovorax cattleyae]AVS75585.1 DUF2917 domain-containing protein [Paracidovorax cattleyae]SDO88087.1 Protein of unknown function [Paracidovorax cattleyae]